VWYNVDSYAVSMLGYWDGRVSVRTTITTDQLADITEFIIEEENSWSIGFNCSWFVTEIWNMASDDHLSSGFWFVNTPSTLCNSIKEKSHYTNYFTGYYDYIFYYDEDTDGLIVCTPNLTGSTSSYAINNATDTNITILNTSFPE